MIKLGFYITLAIILALGAVWFANHLGLVVLSWQGWQVSMSVAVLLLLFLLYTLLCGLLFRLYFWFRVDNPLNSLTRQKKRGKRGLAQLDLGWSAMAVDDQEAALKHGKKAHGLLPENHGPLRLLLKVATDADRQKYLTRLQHDPNSRMVALKYRLENDINREDNSSALALLEEMHQLKPGNSWINHKYFDILTRLGRWSAATTQLDKLAKTKAIDKGMQKHLRAVLCYSQALEADLAGDKTTARDQARQALKYDPAFIPAAGLLSRHYLAAGNKSRARQVIEACWKRAPHPDLGTLFLDLEPVETPGEKFRRIEKLTALNADHRHSLHLRAQVGLESENWAAVKQALSSIIKNNQESSESFHLLARLEIRQKHDEQAAEAHLAQAANAAPNPLWHCAACGTSQDKYSPTCPQCHTFGQIIP